MTSKALHEAAPSLIFRHNGPSPSNQNVFVSSPFLPSSWQMSFLPITQRVSAQEMGRVSRYGHRLVSKTTPATAVVACLWGASSVTVVATELAGVAMVVLLF